MQVNIADLYSFTITSFSSMAFPFACIVLCSTKMILTIRKIKGKLNERYIEKLLRPLYLRYQTKDGPES